MTPAKKIMYLAVLVMVSISALFSSPGLSGLVLCLGNDGHLELESSVNGKCGTSQAALQGPNLVAPEGESHCGTCTDLSLLIVAEDSLRPTQGVEFPKVFSDATIPADAPLFFLERLTLGLLPQPPPLGNLGLAHIRTVRLLV